jgi:hypothetical protein
VILRLAFSQFAFKDNYENLFCMSSLYVVLEVGGSFRLINLSTHWSL